MMKKTLIGRHRELSAQIVSLQNELAAIERSADYANELKLAKDLSELMTTHGKSAEDLAHLLGTEIPQLKRNKRGPKTGTPRAPVTYRNPHTGQEIKTASGNNSVLKEWKKNYPNENIQTWII